MKLLISYKIFHYSSVFDIILIKDQQLYFPWFSWHVSL